MEFLLSILPLLILAIIAWSAYRNLGGLLASFGQYEQAKKFLDKRISRNSADPLLFSQRASVEFTLGNEVAALSDYSKALDLEIDKLERYTIRKGIATTVLTNRAQVYFALEDYDHALADLNEAYQKKPTSHATIAWLAIVNYALDNVEQAEMWWAKAIELFPKYSNLTERDWIINVLGWEKPNEKAQNIIGNLNTKNSTL